MFRSRLRSLVLLVLASCSTSDLAPVEQARCVELRTHLVDLQVREIHVATGIDREAHRKALTAALDDDFIAGCTTKLEESQVTCMLDASNRTTAANCVSTSNQPSKE